MNSPAVARAGREHVDAADLLDAYGEFVAALGCQEQGKQLRRHGAARMLAAHPDLQAWLARSTPSRLADVRRLDAWPFLSWCFATQRLRADAELLLLKGKGGHYATWAACHPQDAARARAAAQRLGWCPEWVDRIARAVLGLACLTQQVALDGLTQAHLDALAAEVDASPLLSAMLRRHLRAEQYGLAELCFQLHLVPAPPPHPNLRATTTAERLAAVPQPEIRRVMLHYLHTVTATLRPKTITERAASLVVFAQWLAATHPQVTSLRQVTRSHLEEFLGWHAQRPCRGKQAGHGRRVSVQRHLHTVIMLRTFFDDIALWGVGRTPRPPGAAPRRPAPPAHTAAEGAGPRRR